MKVLDKLTREQRRTVNEVAVLVVIALIAVAYFALSSSSTEPGPITPRSTEFSTDFNLDGLNAVEQANDNRPNLETDTGKSNPFSF
ncbi:MAG: hypothetical protein WD467_01630 [Candidatus Saccharimonadales bacterium]